MIALCHAHSKGHFSRVIFRPQSNHPAFFAPCDACSVNEEGVFTGDSDKYVLCGFIRKEGRVSCPNSWPDVVHSLFPAFSVVAVGIHFRLISNVL
jgi:hypothetical protein